MPKLFKLTIFERLGHIGILPWIADVGHGTRAVDVVLIDISGLTFNRCGRFCLEDSHRNNNQLTEGRHSFCMETGRNRSTLFEISPRIDFSLGKQMSEHPKTCL